MHVHFRLKYVTDGGAFRYEEVDERGSVVPFKQAKIGTIYLRSTFFGGQDGPEQLTLDISVVK